MFKFFKLIINLKLYFSKPQKKRILIYDKGSYKYASYLFKKNKYIFYDTRYESLNIYVLFFTLLKNGIFKLKQNYKFNFFSFVSPKIIFTAIDNNPSFYTLKSLYKKSIYVSLQNGMRDNWFINEVKKIKKKQKINFFADHIFVFGENEKLKMQKVIKGNYHIIGNVKNNYYSKKRKKSFPIKSLVFISQYKRGRNIRSFNDDFLKNEKLIFNKLIDYSKSSGLNLKICSALRTAESMENKASQENFFRKTFKEGNWKVLYRKSLEKTYNYFNPSQLIVFRWSTLGFENLAKGMKCVAFYKNFPVQGINKYKKKGIFWSNSQKYTEIKKIIERVIKIPNYKWEKISNKYSYDILFFDYKNLKIKKILRDCLVKNY